MCTIKQVVLPKEFCQSPEEGMAKYPDFCPLPEDTSIKE